MRHPSLSEDILAALTRNLGLLRWLGQRVREAQTVRRRGEFVREFCRVLESRFCAMEVVVQPELKARGCQCEVSDSVFVHVVLRPEMDQLLQADEAEDLDGQRVLGFVGRVVDHLQRETAVLGPCIAALLAVDDRFLLGGQVRCYLGQSSETPEEREGLPLRVSSRAPGEH